MSAVASKHPNDVEDVRAAFRLGWAIAELRGRYRPDFRAGESGVQQAPIARTGHALPLANERTSKEQRIEVIHVLEGLSEQLEATFPTASGDTKMKRLDVTLRKLDKTPEDSGAWNELANGLYYWDADIQDRLALIPIQSAAYQLGRGLAETYWALDSQIADSKDARSWLVLLGDDRRATLNRLIARLADFVDPLTVPAVAASLDAWGELASDPHWRLQPDARPALAQQALLWRDLIRGERRPRDLIAGTSALQQIKLLRKLWPVLWPQFVTGVFAVAAVVDAAIALASGAKNVGLATAFGVLGGLGITSASLYGRAKASATSLLASIRDATERERVGHAATRRPKRAQGPQPR